MQLTFHRLCCKFLRFPTFERARYFCVIFRWYAQELPVKKKKRISLYFRAGGNASSAFPVTSPFFVRRSQAFATRGRPASFFATSLSGGLSTRLLLLCWPNTIYMHGTASFKSVDKSCLATAPLVVGFHRHRYWRSSGPAPTRTTILPTYTARDLPIFDEKLAMRNDNIPGLGFPIDACKGELDRNPQQVRMRILFFYRANY